MKRIAILGCENSHADAFLKCIKEMAEFSDVRVVGVYSNEREAAEKLKEKFGVSVMDDYADAVGKIDGLVITARHGDNHYKYAKPYIDSGIPMFIDKPITISEADELYIACWGRSYIAVADIRTMTIKEYVEVPTKIPVSCAFAGEDMDKLVITSATFGVDIEKDKNAGYTFIYDTQTRGRKPYLFG